LTSLVTGKVAADLACVLYAREPNFTDGSSVRLLYEMPLLLVVLDAVTKPNLGLLESRISSYLGTSTVNIVYSQSGLSSSRLQLESHITLLRGITAVKTHLDGSLYFSRDGLLPTVTNSRLRQGGGSQLC
jgi:hypothetical protein